MKIKFWLLAIATLALTGIADSSYLTLEHYRADIPPCKLVNWWPFSIPIDCGQVLQSNFAKIGVIPTAGLGIVYYLSIFVLVMFLFFKPNFYPKLISGLLLFFSSIGVTFSAILVYIMFFVLKAVCLYCLLSAGVSVLIFIGIWMWRFSSKKTKNIYIDLKN